MISYSAFMQDGQDDFYAFDSSYGTGYESYSYEDDYLNREDDNLSDDDQEDTYDDEEETGDVEEDVDVSDDDYTGKSTNNQNDHPEQIQDLPLIDGARPGII